MILERTAGGKLGGLDVKRQLQQLAHQPGEHSLRVVGKLVLTDKSAQTNCSQIHFRTLEAGWLYNNFKQPATESQDSWGMRIYQRKCSVGGWLFSTI